jgi:hypothetical protein
MPLPLLPLLLLLLLLLLILPLLLLLTFAPVLVGEVGPLLCLPLHLALCSAFQCATWHSREQ